MSFGIPVRNGLAVGLLSSTFLSSRRAGGPFSGASLYLNMLTGTLDSRVTFSRGSNATLVDGTGRIVYAPANLFLRSEEFNDAVWLKTAATITANTATAPDGTPTADTFTTAATTSPHQVANATGMGVTFLAGVTYATSIYVKAGTSSFVQIYMATTPFGVDAFANFDLATGTLGTVGSAATASIQAVGNGWYRCSMVATATAAATEASARVSFAMLTTATAIRAESWTGTGNETLFIWGAQLEPVTYQTVPGPYVATTSAAYYGPRFDYNPVTLAPLGLLIEEQRVNLQTYSAQFDDASWVKFNATVTANATTAPDGTSAADTLVETAVTGFHFIQSAYTTTGVLSFSVFLKQNTRRFGGIHINDGVARGCSIDLQTGTLGTPYGGATASVVNYGNGWYRLTVTATAGASGNTTVYVSDSNALASYAGNGTSGIFIYGAQLEAGSFATSYIPTVASQVTRLADVATMTGTNFSSWYNQPAGTFVLDGDTFTVSTVDFPLTANDGSNNNRFGVYRSNLSLAGYVVTGNVTQMELTSAVAAVNTTFRVAVAATANNGNVAINGNIGAGDTSITMPTVDRLSIGSNNGAGVISGHIRQIAYFNTRLPNAQLEALTAPPLITSLSLDFLNGVYEG